VALRLEQRLRHSFPFAHPRFPSISLRNTEEKREIGNQLRHIQYRTKTLKPLEVFRSMLKIPANPYSL
jgi:hypothetical protein